VRAGKPAGKVSGKLPGPTGYELYYDKVMGELTSLGASRSAMFVSANKSKGFLKETVKV